jgi:hypothetical protein
MHYERVPWATVADGWCRLTLGDSLQSLAVVADDGRPGHTSGTRVRCGTSDVKDAHVVHPSDREVRKPAPLTVP